jgi:CO/xanthine dehydrogenase Mo-binding subunit
VRERRCRGDVVDCDDVQIGSAIACCAHDVASNPSESVDADLDRHGDLQLR